jgi:hypothetical protein
MGMTEPMQPIQTMATGARIFGKVPAPAIAFVPASPRESTTPGIQGMGASGHMDKEWNIYDADDSQTHPGDVTEVEIELEEGHLFHVIYTRRAGLFSMPEGTRIGGTIKRWRYINEPPDVG